MSGTSSTIKVNKERSKRNKWANLVTLKKHIREMNDLKTSLAKIRGKGQNSKLKCSKMLTKCNSLSLNTNDLN